MHGSGGHSTHSTHSTRSTHSTHATHSTQNSTYDSYVSNNSSVDTSTVRSLETEAAVQTSTEDILEKIRNALNNIDVTDLP